MPNPNDDLNAAACEALTTLNVEGFRFGYESVTPTRYPDLRDGIRNFISMMVGVRCSVDLCKYRVHSERGWHRHCLKFHNEFVHDGSEHHDY